MKKAFLIITLILLTLGHDRVAIAATPQPTVSIEKQSTASSDLDRIEKIKEMVASKVAELKLVEKRALYGIIREASNTQVTIDDLNQNIRIIDIDELTKFQASSKSFGISDVKKGDRFYFLGLYNKDTKRLLARFVIQGKPFATQFDGVIIEKDKKNYNLIAIDDKGQKMTISIELQTKIKAYSKDGGFVKSGFSKINTGERIIVNGFYDPSDKTIILADRIIEFTDPILTVNMKKYVDEANARFSTPSANVSQ